MAEYLNTNRVFGRSIGNMKDQTPVTKNAPRNRTPEQKEEDHRRTVAALDYFMQQREARIAKYRIPEVRKLRHKDIIM